MKTHLTQSQIDAFQRDGAIVAPDAVTPGQLDNLRAEFTTWVEESRTRAQAYGQICDGRPRFDLEDDHTPDRPSLRRVASPTDVSETYASVAFDSVMTDMAAALLGPNVRSIRTAMTIR